MSPNGSGHGHGSEKPRRSPPPKIVDDDGASEDELGDAAPLPDISARRTGRTRSSFTSGVGVGAQAAGVNMRARGPGRQRAFSAGAGDGGVVTKGGRMPTSAPILPEEDEAKPVPVSPNPGFSDLTRNASHLSQRSNRTFADAAALVNMPDLRREDTITERRARARAGTVTTMASLARHLSVLSDGISEKLEEGDGEELVAVQITDTGEEIVYPEGGLQAWLVLFGGFCAAICAFGLGASVGAFQSYYQQHLLKDYTASQIAWIGSAQAAICFSTCLFTGPLFDRYGCRPLLALGTFLLVLGFCMLSLATQYYQIFLCHATLIAMGMDFTFIVPMGAVGQWFFLRRGLAFGILMMGSSLGAIVWPVIVANLPQKIGFPWTCRLIALLIGLLGITSTLLVKTRLPPRPPGPFFYFKEFANPAYACVALSFPFFIFGFFSFLTFIGSYGALAGLGDFAPYLLMIANGSSGFGRLAAGIAADSFGTFNVAIMGEAAMVILTFAWLAMKTSGPLIALCVLYGLASGAPVSLQGPMITASATDPRLAGSLIGQALMVQSFAQLTGPPIFGAIVGAGTQEEQLKRFPQAIIFGACMLTVSTCLILSARLYRTRQLTAII